RVDSGSGVRGERQRGLPEQLARGLIEGPKLTIVVRCSDENQSSRGDNRASIALAACVLHALLRQLRIFAERDLPHIFAGVQVNGIESTPRRRDRRVAIGVQKL